MELQNGKLSIFGVDSLNAHFDTINLTADSAINVDTQALNLNIKGKKTETIGGGYDQKITGSLTTSISGAYGCTSSGFKVSSPSGDFSISGAWNVHASSIYETASGSLNLKGATALVSGGALASIGGTITQIGGIVMMGSSTPAGSASPASPGSPSSVVLGSVEGPPTPDQIASSSPGDPQSYATTVVPQHEPWSGHIMSTAGTNGYVEEDAAVLASYRTGALSGAATKPMTVIGKPRSDMPAGVYEGNTYTTTNNAEDPTWTNTGTFSGGPASGYDISPNGLNLIKQFEGKRLSVYRDAVGLPTIGYGHLIKPGETFTTITDDEATTLLHDDVQRFVQNIRDNVDVQITQNQFDAMVSLSFNIGSGNFDNSTLLDNLNNENYSEATQQFMVWRKAGGRVIAGLETRRRAEATLFATA